jgi:hypothetical protein
MRAAPELLDAPTIVGGCAWLRGGGGWSRRSHISHPSRPKYMKMAQKQTVSPSLIDLKNAESAVFCLKVLNKIYSQDVF